MLSLTSRLLISLSIVLICFLGGTGYVLDKSFQESTKDATHDRLHGYAMALIAAAEVKINGNIYIPDILPIVGFNQFNSGLYAQVFNSQGEILWKSSSASEKDLPINLNLKNTESSFAISHENSNEKLFNFSYGVSWDLSNKSHVYTINILESLSAYEKDVNVFRNKLWIWLGGVSFLLIIVQGSLMRWSLRPIRNAAIEIELIEKGEITELRENYPKELRILTKNLNALMKSNKQHLSRYRNSLSDLAHSLKTPLALLSSASETHDTRLSLDKVVSEQVNQMKKIVDYQLQRASTSGQNPLSTPINIKTITEKINASLLKVYTDKNIASKLNIEKNIKFFGDESDIYELLGNTIDNAFKWASSEVIVNIRTSKSPDQLHILIEDDGPGIDPKLAEKVLERGIRSDERSGTGIGLAITNDIVQAYDGSIEIDKSELGGCLFLIKLSQTHF